MRMRLISVLAGVVLLAGAIVLSSFASAYATGHRGPEMMAGHGTGMGIGRMPMTGPGHEARPGGTPAVGAGPEHSAGHHGQSPYAGTFDPAGPIRALTPEEVDQIRAGAGMGLARAAELNGLPGPRHVLDLGAELQLAPEQRAEFQAIYDRMLAAALEAGRRYLAAQEAFEADLRAGQVTIDALSERVAEVNRLRSELQTVHLKAHLETAAKLSAEQVTRYNALRGY